MKTAPDILLPGIVPVGKPRMTRRDKWARRPCVLRYREYADDLRQRLAEFTVPAAGMHVRFTLPMPHSWSKTKRREHRGRAHQQKPDVDNLLKAFFDALLKDDSGIWDCRASKVWGESGAIEITLTEDTP